MTRPVTWGVLGASHFALSTMAPAIHAARRARLAALATRHAPKAAPFEAFAPDLRVHDSYDALLADPEIDAVYIPLPNALHVAWTERAVDAGKAVLCEKPIGLHVADLDRLRALRDVGVYPIGGFRLATGLEPEVTGADAIWEGGVDTSTWVQARAGDVRFGFHVSMRTTRRQEMVFEGEAGWLVVRAPFNPGPFGEATLHLARPGQPDLVERFPDFRQYEAQVEAVAASLLDGAAFAMPLEASRGTQAVLDAVFDRLGPAR
jgi:predicted dehydrogenase